MQRTITRVFFQIFDGLALPKQSTCSTPVNPPAVQKESEHNVHALRVTGYVRRVSQNTFNIPFWMILSVTEFSQLFFCVFAVSPTSNILMSSIALSAGVLQTSMQIFFSILRFLYLICNLII